MKALRLTAEEGFVLSRLDAPLSVKELVDLTGIEAARVVEIVEGLATQGAIDVDREGGAPAAAPAASVQSASPVAARAQPVREEEEESKDDAAPEQTTAEIEAAEVEAQTAAAEPGDGADDEDPEDKIDGMSFADRSREYQKIYERVYHPLQRDERVAAALTVDGADLFALCLDPDPQVIHSILANPHSGLPHARMIATHHRTHVGLDLIARRSEFLSDQQVQRRLVANPQLPEMVLRKIVNPKLLTEVYKLAINREIPEKSRNLTRELLNKKFMLASADERAAMLIKTEGRCLVLLINAALDARTTQMLVSKTSYSLLFIQNLARWSATPPALLVHLLKQPIVRQNMGLRKMILKHKNVPSETKRNFSA